MAKAYRLLKAIFNTAVDDGLLRRNPCRIKGAGQEESPERPVLTVPQVYALADAVGGLVMTGPGVACGGLDLASGHNAPFCGFPTGAG